MAFKMNRPGKMNGPKKSTINKYGRKAKSADDSGLYYNSKMGPMQMHSPTALKQMEEGMGDMGGMEEMMGMMGDTGGGAPAENAPVEKEGGGDKAKTIFGQEIVINKDGTMKLDDEYGIAGIPKGAKIKDPNEHLIIKNGFVTDDDYTFEVNKDGDVVITGIKDRPDPEFENADEVD